MKVLTVLVSLLLMLSLLGCGESSQDLAAEATRISQALSETQSAVTPASTSTAVPEPTDTAIPEPTDTALPEPTDAASPEPTNTLPPTVEEVAAELSPAEIFANISPSVAFIETRTATGSGLLTDGRYVVTNAHVIWPYRQVRVVFPDGSEYLNAPVIGWDLMVDLALIGPLNTQLPTIPLTSGESLAVGSETYLIGYPGEVEAFPQPAITVGLVSRLREWAQSHITYYQTDAALAGGQSGGVLVSSAGQVIGISGFSFSEADFGLVASAEDLLPRVDTLVDGRDLSGLGDRLLPTEGGNLEFDFELDNLWHEAMFVIDEPIGAYIELACESDGDSFISAADAYCDVLVEADDTLDGLETGAFSNDWDTPVFVIIGQYSEGKAYFEVSSTHRLRRYQDPDDGRSIQVGETLPANIDYPNDIDYFLLDLDAGQTIDILINSVAIDPYVTVDFEGASEDELVADDDHGGGLFGLDAQLTYRAPHTGTFFVVVADAYGCDTGGYYVAVNPQQGMTP